MPNYSRSIDIWKIFVGNDATTVVPQSSTHLPHQNGVNICQMDSVKSNKSSGVVKVNLWPIADLIRIYVFFV